MIKKRPIADVIAGTKQLPARTVPQHKRKVAKQPIDTGLSPTPIGIHYQRTVAPQAELPGTNTEFTGQFIAIIEPDIGHDRQVTMLADGGLELKPVLSGDRSRPMTENQGTILFGLLPTARGIATKPRKTIQRRVQ